jgi:K+-transporting ATPase ATPase B chain
VSAGRVREIRRSPKHRQVGRHAARRRKDGRLLGVIHLKDIVKGGIRERFAELRRMGIRTVMITGDNPMTAAAIAAEAGVDDFLAQATPEDKLQADPRRAGQGQARRHVRRRHQRRRRRWPRPTSASP